MIKSKKKDRKKGKDEDNEGKHKKKKEKKKRKKKKKKKISALLSQVQKSVERRDLKIFKEKIFLFAAKSEDL